MPCYEEFLNCRSVKLDTKSAEKFLAFSLQKWSKNSKYKYRNTAISICFAPNVQQNLQVLLKNVPISVVMQRENINNLKKFITCHINIERLTFKPTLFLSVGQ